MSLPSRSTEDAAPHAVWTSHATLSGRIHKSFNKGRSSACIFEYPLYLESQVMIRVDMTRPCLEAPYHIPGLEI